MKDNLGDRMKWYENITRNYLIPRSYSLLRVDGRAFHNYTKNLNKPFDEGLINDLDETWLYLCNHIQNAKLGYAQSDEFSLLLTDFDNISTEQFFGGNIQKIVSVVSSMAAAKFNFERLKRLNSFSEIGDLASFDCRVWNIPNKIEIYNYFLWRYNDCVRNSVSSVCHSTFSHKQMQGKKISDMHYMLVEKGINWAEMDESLKNGRFLIKGENGWKIEEGFKITENPDKLLEWIP